MALRFRNHPPWLAALALLFSLCSCALGPGSSNDPAQMPMAYYLDANLGIALEHPQYWPRQKRVVNPDPDAQLTVSWQPRRRWGMAPELGMTLTSLPPNRAIGGFATLLQRYLERRPDVISGNQEETVVAGLPGLRLEARTGQRQLLVYFVTSAQRAVILEFSASPAKFAADLALFEKIAASLTMLTPATGSKLEPSRSD